MLSVCVYKLIISLSMSYLKYTASRDLAYFSLKTAQDEIATMALSSLFVQTKQTRYIVVLMFSSNPLQAEDKE